MSIDTSFYNNVSLLTEMIPPSPNFKRIFKKGMFDKSNTAAFIHVSHYLLNVYNETRFKALIIWPLLCKEDELKYRAAVKDYLTILSEENPDLRFPPIVMSHLIQAKGLKFRTIIWKLSQLALRAYLERKCEMTLCRAPIPSKNNDLAKTYLANFNRRNQAYLSDFCSKRKETLRNYDIELTKELDHTKCLKREILYVNRRVEELLLLLVPKDSELRERLKNIDDEEVITKWKAKVIDGYKYLVEQNREFNKLQNLCSLVYELVRNLMGKSKVDDAEQHRIVSDKRISLMYAKYIKEDLDSELYQDGSLVYKTFFSLFLILLEEILFSLQNTDISELCRFEPKVKECCNSMKTAKEIMQELYQHVSTQINHLSNTLIEADFNSMCESNRSSFEILLSSPNKLSLSFNEPVEEKLLNRLCPSPPRDQYKQLFKRHCRMLHFPPRKSMTKFCLSDKTERSSHLCFPILKRGSPKALRSFKSLKYSRLFSNRHSKKGYITADYKATSTPNTTIENTLSDKDASEVIDIPKKRLHASVENLFDLTDECTNSVTSFCESSSRNNSLR